ncbi:MAG: hypothetical protein RLZZ522_2252, partial [Verrucomicrobiota bacterium]
MLPKITRSFPAFRRIRRNLVALLATPALAAPPPIVWVGKGSEWRYQDDGSDQGAAWCVPEFADAAWKNGKAKLGYEDGAVTTIGFGPDQAHKFITTYFRKGFTVPDPQGLAALRLNLLRDDAAVAYLNGVEVARSNLPQGESRATSSDLGFDLSLTAPGPEASTPAAMLTRGPYLQMAAPTAMTLRWRTAKPQPGVVHFGLAPTALDQTAAESAPTTEHEIALSGLKPATTYFYNVGSATEVLAGGPDFSFTTPPPTGPAKPTRVWVLGDAGTQTINQIRVRNAFYTHAAQRLPDLCLLLGDNAYDV